MVAVRLRTGCAPLRRGGSTQATRGIVVSQASNTLVIDLVASAVLVIPILALARVIVRRDPVPEDAMAPADPELLETAN